LLAELRIRNLAIIDELWVELSPGFCVLTGETGAGKSIIVDSLELALGGRADTTAIRAGGDRASVEACFKLDARERSNIDTVLLREGLEGEDANTLLLGREVRDTGRSICRVNGRAVSLGLLREVASGLVDIHGQSEHLSLLRVPEHIELLDRFGELTQLRAEVADLVQSVRLIRRRLSELRQREQELRQRSELLRFQIGEIESASLVPGEEEELLGERIRLANSEKLASAVREALESLEGTGADVPNARDLLGLAVTAVGRLASIDPSAQPQLRAAEGIGYQVDDLVQELRAYSEHVEYNPKRLQEVEDRLALLRGLERKHGPTIADVLAYADEARGDLKDLSGSEQSIEDLLGQEHRLLGRLAYLGVQLSCQRREVAGQLSQQIEGELVDLRMSDARLSVEMHWCPDPDGVDLDDGLVADLGLQDVASPLDGQRVAFSEVGFDVIEFLMSPNRGEPMKPLAKIASGGETSRIMLALKAVLSRADATSTLVFDEIDQGIGGRVGATVGAKLWGLSLGEGPRTCHRQVICVTHLPQLASYGDFHLRVEKVVEGDRSVTRVRRLEGQDRVLELAQMLGANGRAGYETAESMLTQVEDCKRDLLQKCVDAGAAM
jgi:DNA repair protein RecN (Recombination protein N)